MPGLMSLLYPSKCVTHSWCVWCCMWGSSAQARTPSSAIKPRPRSSQLTALRWSSTSSSVRKNAPKRALNYDWKVFSEIIAEKYQAQTSNLGNAILVKNVRKLNLWNSDDYKNVLEITYLYWKPKPTITSCSSNILQLRSSLLRPR